MRPGAGQGLGSWPTGLRPGPFLCKYVYTTNWKGLRWPKPSRMSLGPLHNKSEHRRSLTSVQTCHTHTYTHPHLKIAILPQFLRIEPHFVRKGCEKHRQIGKCNFTPAFDDRTSFRAKRLPRHKSNRNFTAVFNDRTSFRAKGLLRHKSNRKVHFYRSF